MNKINNQSISKNSIMPKAHSYIYEIDNYVPGKAKIDNKTQKIIKLSSNENAFGASKIALESYMKHSQNIFRYADGSCEKLREKIAQKNNINIKQIVCGAGSDELISLLTSAYCGIGDEVIYSEYGFLMYPISAKKVGAKAIKVKEKDFRCDINAIIEAINEKTKIIFIANPNNPTGSYLNSDEINILINKIPKNIMLILDHAYEEYVTASDYPNILSIVNNNANVVMLRTFSKIYGLASLRIGWCYCSEKIAEILHKIRGPFNVSGAAQESAIASLDDDNFVNDSRLHNKKWLDFIQHEVKNFNNLKAYKSVANFILFDFLNEKNYQKSHQLFLENNIILREMLPYGLPNCLRITIGKDNENEQVLKILKIISNLKH